MKTDRIESLVSWMFTGAILIGIGLFILIRVWLSTNLNVRFTYRGASVDPQIALGGSVLLIVIGVVLVACSVIGKLRNQS